MMRLPKRAAVGLVAVVSLALTATSGTAGADHLDDGLGQGGVGVGPELEHDPSAALAQLDAAASQIISEGLSAKVIKNLQLQGRGQRLDAQATTDVWAFKNFAYTGTFNSPCGGEEGAGIWVWDVWNKNRPSRVGVIESETGSRSNDVKVATMNSGDILVHSNETCGAGGLGGFEVYNVDDPRSPVHLATQRVREPNPIMAAGLAGGMNRGVHNLFLFTQGSRDYVALATHGNAVFGSTQIFEITDPANPEFVSAWGPEFLCDAEFCSDDPYNETDISTLNAMISEWIGGAAAGRTPGFRGSLIRSVHDITVTEDGNLMYAAAWDSGLILLDISDPANPEVVSQALDVENGSLDGEVNSHSMWPSEDGTIVVEGEEDFNAWVTVQPLGNFTFGEESWNTVPGVGVTPAAGDDFEANQTGNMVTVTASSVTVDSGPLAGNVYPAEEGAGNQPKIADTGPITAEAVWVGRGCDTDNFGVPGADTPGIVDPHLNDPAGKIAVIRRGGLSFSSKLGAAQAAGAVGVIIANNLTEDTPWSGVRIWDYSDPANPVLASTFDTTCSASPTPIPECDPFGTYSVHNVITETTDDGRVKAYLSWYWDGMLVLDVTDPYNPKEIARYFDNSPAFLDSNGGLPHDFWGVGKEPAMPWIYGSDRNGGLYVFKEQGSGSR